MLLHKVYQVMQETKSLATNLRNQGKSEEQIKQAINVYLSETKKKINPHNEDLI